MRYSRTLAIAKRHERLLALIRTSGYSSPGLAEELEVSEQTIYRDIRCLKEQGHPIKAIRQQDRWVYRLSTNGTNRSRRSRRRQG